MRKAFATNPIVFSFILDDQLGKNMFRLNVCRNVPEDHMDAPEMLEHRCELHVVTSTLQCRHRQSVPDARLSNRFDGEDTHLPIFYVTF